MRFFLWATTSETNPKARHVAQTTSSTSWSWRQKNTTVSPTWKKLQVIFMTKIFCPVGGSFALQNIERHLFIDPNWRVLRTKRPTTNNGNLNWNSAEVWGQHRELKGSTQWSNLVANTFSLWGENRRHWETLQDRVECWLVAIVGYVFLHYFNTFAKKQMASDKSKHWTTLLGPFTEERHWTVHQVQVLYGFNTEIFQSWKMYLSLNTCCSLHTTNCSLCVLLSFHIKSMFDQSKHYVLSWGSRQNVCFHKVSSLQRKCSHYPFWEFYVCFLFSSFLLPLWRFIVRICLEKMVYLKAANMCCSKTLMYQ